MWTRAELKEKAKSAFKMNYWKTVLVALILSAVAGTFFGAGAGSAAGSSAGAGYSYSFDGEPPIVESYELTDEEIDQMVEQYVTNPEASDDMDISVEELIEQTGITPTENGFHFEIGPAQLFLIGILGVIVLVFIAIVFAVNAFLINPFVVGVQRFSIRNLNSEAEVKEAAYGFDNNYKQNVKTMFQRDILILLWSLLFIIPGIVKAYEYRMIPYLLADDPTMTKDRAFAESRAMMHGNKWRAFVLDLSFLGWRLLSVLTLGILEVFYVAPYKFMTDAALYEALRYGPSAPEFADAGAYAEQIPVPPFATEAGFAPENPEA